MARLLAEFCAAFSGLSFDHWATLRRFASRFFSLHLLSFADRFSFFLLATIALHLSLFSAFHARTLRYSHALQLDALPRGRRLSLGNSSMDFSPLHLLHLFNAEVMAVLKTKKPDLLTGRANPVIQREGGSLVSVFDRQADVLVRSQGRALCRQIDLAVVRENLVDAGRDIRPVAAFDRNGRRGRQFR